LLDSPAVVVHILLQAMAVTTISLKYLLQVGLFTVLLLVGANLTYPLVPQIPLVLTDAFAMLAAVTIGPWWSLLAVGLFLGLGLLGLPVFGGSGGLAIFSSPRVGFLVGYLPSVVLAGWIAGGAENLSDRPLTYWSRLIAGTVVGFLALQLPAGLGFIIITRCDLVTAVNQALLPFWLPDLFKILFVILLATPSRKSLV
jgi:biotin transport system substrate-specific component